MAIVTVRHLPENKLRDMNSLSGNDEIVSMVNEEMRNNNYIRVAELEVTSTIDDCLNLAFKETQNLHQPWVQNADVQVEDFCKEGCRSTSVGDVIQIRGVSYAVMPVGFKELPN
jgi:hypothetical protein